MLRPPPRRRFPMPVSHEPSPLVCLERKTFLLLLAVVFAVGLFGGAIAFGELLIRQHAP